MNSLLLAFGAALLAVVVYSETCMDSQECMHTSCHEQDYHKVCNQGQCTCLAQHNAVNATSCGLRADCQTMQCRMQHDSPHCFDGACRCMHDGGPPDGHHMPPDSHHMPPNGHHIPQDGQHNSGAPEN